MKMFENIGSILRLLWENGELIDQSKYIADKKIPHVGVCSAFFGEREGVKKKPPERLDAAVLIGKIKNAIEGIRNLDLLVQEVRHLRGEIVSEIVDMRNAYELSAHVGAVCKLVGMNYKTPEDEIRPVVAEILGYDVLPDEFVNVRALEFRHVDFAGFEFGVDRKPTNVKVVIPVETDYVRTHDFSLAEEEIEKFDVYDLERRFVPEIDVLITLGAVSECGNYGVEIRDTISSKCVGFDELEEKIRKSLFIDVRDEFETRILDVADVKDVDDFIYWRALRSANAAAERNTRR